jgi:DNA modification methylase
MKLDQILEGDKVEILKNFPNDCVDLIVTSPPYNNWRNRRTQKKEKPIGIGQIL